MNPKVAAGYALTMALVAAVFGAVSSFGTALAAPPPPPGQPLFDRSAATEVANPLAHVLLAVAIVIVAARAIGALFRRFGQPPVIGEMLAGILLGPSLLGSVFPAASAFLLPPAVAPQLGILAQIGVVLFLFLVGLELDTEVVRQRSRTAIAVAWASMTVPFVLGSLMALLLYPATATSDVPFVPFALFVAVAMSVTAFPVLARILGETGLQKTALGGIALAAAAAGDVTAWCLLAVVVGVAKATAGAAVTTVALAIAFTAVMLLLVRPAVVRWVGRQSGTASASAHAMVVLLVGLLATALAAEAIGIHALFGAFLFGAIIPHDSELAKVATQKLTDVVVVLFLPVFFAFTGLRTQIGLVEGGGNWLLCALVVAVATAGKVGGAYLAARANGLDRREAGALGALMNTRGMMELVVLNVGLDLRLISPLLFAMMVTMALVTTLATTPLLHLLGVTGTAGAATPQPVSWRATNGPR
ncbi:MAG: cation:proton antiporter [Planctomycetota bacterium]